MNHTPLNTVQLICVFMLSIGLMNHVIVVPLLLDAAGRDAWISATMAFAALPLWLPLLYFVMKQSNQMHLFLWLKTEFKSVIAYFVAILGSLLLLVIGYVTVNDTVTFITTTFLTRTPDWVILLILTVMCFYNSYYGIPSIAKTAFILLPFVVIFGMLVAITTTPHKDYSLLKPIMENGFTPVLKGMIYAGAGNVEIFLILFMQHYLPARFSFKSLLIISVLAASLGIGPTIGAIIEFGPKQAADLRYPAFEEWGLISLGTYIEYLDFLAVYQWMSGAFIRISLATALIPELFHVTDKKARLWILIVIYITIFLLSLLPISDDKFLDFLYRFVLPSSLLSILSLSLLIGILALISYFKKRRA
ncbi:endospore germination permease [Parageobacillus sp. VR-IP]|uniref:GerAB/ArcD/ProY family transporter n=1 Tax=Parageobacillus sp. VR-IP TaxID=2742205 RepID=UPI001581492D|nr:endospore germination permease [Parageobacillus sp. VR-IP]NUK31399.1 endospore germination permease [Parageobacillus sp. VR-IP]